MPLVKPSTITAGTVPHALRVVVKGVPSGGIGTAIVTVDVGALAEQTRGRRAIREGKRKLVSCMMVVEVQSWDLELRG